MAKKKNKGWIRLHRTILESSIWPQNERYTYCEAWIDLLLHANHDGRTIKTRSNQFIEIKAGQQFTSMEVLAKRWHWSRRTIIRFLSHLSAQGMVTTRGTPDGTLITIVNWGFYQTDSDKRDTTVDTTDDTTGDTMDDTTGDTRTRINKNDNKECKKKKAAPPLKDARGFNIE